MTVSPRYWKIWRINPAGERLGYQQILAPLAKEFVQKQLTNSQNSDIKFNLISYFQGQDPAVDDRSRAQAGLCLRCYVSEPILKACRKLDSLFGVQKQFSYQDLLTFALNDDGKTLVILDSDRKKQLILNEKGEPKTTAYQFFTVKVLQTFDADSQSSMSLDNWAYLQTKQNPEIKKFLSEFGFKNLSDWALLNRARPKQIEILSERDRYLVEVYHTVYRRDRVEQRKLGAKRCPDPNTVQLQEMLTYLLARNIIIKSTSELLKELKQVAVQLRQYDVWRNREPLEIRDPDSGNYTTRTDLPYESRDELDVEQQELVEFLHRQLRIALTQTIQQEIRSRITKLEKSTKYAPFAQQFIPGLQLYYNQGLSLKDIAPRLGMTSWDQARRILNPGELLNKVRVSCVQQLLERLLKKAQEKGLTKIPPKSEYLQSIAEQIEAFADAEIFQAAVKEIRAGKNRKMESLYSQQLCLTLNKAT